jgi:hypothetical protein
LNNFLFVVGVLVNFYSSRLSDPASVPNLMTGLIALTSKFENFNAACTNAVVDGYIYVNLMY